MDEKPLADEGMAAYRAGMNSNPILPLLALALASACAGSTRAPAGAPRPTFSAYRAGAPRPVTLTAPYGGYLTQRGPCLGLTIHGRFATIIWPETARLEFDRRGLLLSDTASGVTLRLGDYLVGTGGPLPRGVPHSIGDDILTEGFPVECARWYGYEGWIGIVNSGFGKGQPARR
ncbi:MAG: hypothetical protein QOJ91_2741 [Sphingomonadales bacterium]|jgi:hypothetical protein|nr:hypothetical protein [Sphingomonadales bacterium]